MDLRSPVKNALRMCGHAVVSTIHERLNWIERALHDILEQNVHIASTQTALLQSGIHLVENLTRIQTEVHEAENRIAARLREECASRAEVQALGRSVAEVEASLGEVLTAIQAELVRADSRHVAETLARLQANVEDVQRYMEVSVGEKIENLLQAGIDRMANVGESMRQTTASSLALLEPAAHETNNFLANQSVRQICIDTSDYLATNPELGLFAFLYSFLPSRKVLDIGAHIGDFSEHLLKSGYEVFAFEPYPPSYRRLHDRLSMCSQFHSFPFAVGSTAGELPLYLTDDRSSDGRYEDPTVFHSLTRHAMPADLVFTNSSVTVNVRRVSDLHKEGVVPVDVSLVKIDTEGFDLEVIRGMQDYRYPVVMTEFWDPQTPFGGQGLLYTTDTMVAEMRARGYFWHIVIYRIWGRPHTAFYCNYERSVPESWGNVIFFRDQEVFAEAEKWCSAVLPRTYFRHVPSTRAAGERASFA